MSINCNIPYNNRNNELTYLHEIGDDDSFLSESDFEDCYNIDYFFHNIFLFTEYFL